MSPETPPIGPLHHVMLWARDLDTAVRWYHDTLQFEVVYHAPCEYASLYHPTMGALALHGAGEGDTGHIGHGPMPYYGADDLDRAVAWLTARGVSVDPIQQVSESPRHTWFRDCEGNTLGLEELR